MGNIVGSRSKKNTTKVMKVTGETLKLKTPIQAGTVLLTHPGHVLLESESVKHYGLRAKPLEPSHELKPKRLYFLVEMPKTTVTEDDDNRVARRVRSVIHMSAKDRLESLMLARRSSSDLSIMRPPPPPARARIDGVVGYAEEGKSVISEGSGGVRLRMRISKAELERLMAESGGDGDDVAERIVRLCLAKGDDVAAVADVVKPTIKSRPREKRVGFNLPVREGEIHQLVDGY